MRQGTIVAFIFVAAGAILLVACASSSGSEQVKPAVSTPTVAAVATATAAPVVKGTPTPVPDLEAGKAAYLAKCESCHPGGHGGQGPTIIGIDRNSFEDKVRVGGGFSLPMPAFSSDEISDKLLGDIAAYAATLK